ncbi:MAG: glycosyl transferase family protein [Candidatus Sedimenticola endophacoides]
MHEFARFIQILGKGRNGMKPLTREQAYEAMHMIACYDVEPEQLGAFLMLMRVKEETAAEVAGFTEALRESLPNKSATVRPAIDWAAYAGKKRQLPWFVLAALVLAARGYPVFMHGLNRNDERLYVPDALDALDLSPSSSLGEAQQRIDESGFAYLPISKLSPLTAELIATRDLFGLRPPLHTVARMLNPLSASLAVMGVFHPNFAEIHQQAAVILGQEKALICKGEGGEFERIPDRSVQLYGVGAEGEWCEIWDHRFPTGKEVKPERLNLRHFRAVWDGDAEDFYGEHAVVGTLGWVIRALELSKDAAEVHRIALDWWRNRHQPQSRQEAV